MASIKTFSPAGEATGELEFPDHLMVLGRGAQAVHETVLHLMAGRRHGTASTLRKGEVAGSNKKPWKQKGTGRARAGLRQSPVWRGGGVAFGPHPRSFANKLNRKVARLAFQRALSDRVAAGDVRVLDELKLAGAKTRHLVGLLKALKVSPPVLFVVDKLDRDLGLAARNIPGVEAVPAQSVSVYHLVRYPVIVVMRAAVDVLRQRLGKGDAGSEQPVGVEVKS